MKLVTADEMKQIEQWAEEDEKFPVPTRQLMLNAGQSVFEAIVSQERFEQTSEGYSELEDGLAVVLSGPGNNGGDALVTAALLGEMFPELEVKIYFYRRPRLEDIGQARDDLTYTEAEELDGIELTSEPAFESLEADLQMAALVVDGLLGSGINRPVSGALVRVIDLVNEAREERRYDPENLLVFSIDVPSGLNSDSGEVVGVAIQADLTVTLGYPKRGVYTHAAAAYTGRVVIGDIGIPDGVRMRVEQEAEEKGQTTLITSDWTRRNLPERPLVGHKGTFGKLMIASGASQYIGAPYLCTMAGLRAGAGLVTLAIPGSLIQILGTRLTENTYLPLPELNTLQDAQESASLLVEQAVKGNYAVIVLGPGWGQDELKLELLRHLIELAGQADNFPPMVIDADGLNLLAKLPDWHTRLKTLNILTPHPGELANLRGVSIADIEADRVESVRAAALALNQVVVLKGAYTVIASPDGRVRVNPAANPAMATAGSGDVLAGIIGGILAQSRKNSAITAFEAACLATYLHSMAGELVRREMGDMGALAGDFLTSIPAAVVALRRGDRLE